MASGAHPWLLSLSLPAASASVAASTVTRPCRCPVFGSKGVLELLDDSVEGGRSARQVAAAAWTGIRQRERGLRGQQVSTAAPEARAPPAHVATHSVYRMGREAGIRFSCRLPVRDCVQGFLGLPQQVRDPPDGLMSQQESRRRG